MMTFAHAAVGAALALLLARENPRAGKILLALGAAFLSHFLLDALPHWNPPFPIPPTPARIWPVAIDFAAAGAILLLFCWRHSTAEKLLLLGGAAAGVLPDALLAGEMLLKISSPLAAFHAAVQFETSPFLGAISQILVVGLAALAVSKNLSRPAREREAPRLPLA